MFTKLFFVCVAWIVHCAVMMQAKITVSEYLQEQCIVTLYAVITKDVWKGYRKHRLALLSSQHLFGYCRPFLLMLSCNFHMLYLPWIDLGLSLCMTFNIYSFHFNYVPYKEFTSETSSTEEQVIRERSHANFTFVVYASS